MTDLALAIAHHLAVFALAGLLVAEIALLGRTPGPDRIRQLAAIDAFYGGTAMLVIVVGVGRVVFGAAGWDYYVANWAFWAKMAAFLAVGVLSVAPTRAFLSWRRALATDAGFVPAHAEVRRLRLFFAAQVVIFALIPTFAAVMARGYGTL